MKNNLTLLIFLIVTNLGFSQIFNWSPTAISGDWQFPFNWVEGIPVDGAANIVFNNNAQLVSTNNLTPLGVGFSITDITFVASVENTTKNLMTRKEAIQKTAKFMAVTALATFIILNPKKAQAQSGGPGGPGF